MAWCKASELHAPSEPLPPRLMLATLIPLLAAFWVTQSMPPKARS
jgi:hypothetical protein